MINSKRLTELARKWEKMAAMEHRRIQSMATKGYSAVYTAEYLRFSIPLEFLSKSVFRELLGMSKEEFGLPTSGPITVPCESGFLEYVMSLLRGHIPESLEKALLTSLATYHCSGFSSLAVGLGHSHPQVLVFSY